MARSSSRSAPVQPESFVECLRYFLTASLWKQVLGRLRRGKASRWQPQPLLFVLLVMTWCAGDSQPERFETARAFYVASYQKRRRPGTTCEGFQKALARVPVAPCVWSLRPCAVVWPRSLRSASKSTALFPSAVMARACNVHV